MTQTTVKLVTFGISHYCEKARWALDWHSIPYTEIGWPPGLHQLLAKKCGAKATTLPILLDGAKVIQDSSFIIDWAEAMATDRSQNLTPKVNTAEAKEIERRANDVIGVHVRRLAYAETLPSCPHVVKPALFERTFGWQRVVGNTIWPVTWRIIMQMYEIRPGAAAESRSALERELDWLDKKLADGRSYLVGDSFSRVDLTVASLLAGFARPEEMPVYRQMLLPDTLTGDVERWRDRPIMRWVVSQYRSNRFRKDKVPLAA
jgi:glutathione S-transferase